MRLMISQNFLVLLHLWAKDSGIQKRPDALPSLRHGLSRNPEFWVEASGRTCLQDIRL